VTLVDLDLDYGRPHLGLPIEEPSQKPEPTSRRKANWA
jgi:hypothetical protein